MAEQPHISSQDASHALKQILEKHGMAILDEPERLKSLLLDTCPRRETMLLVTAAEDGVPQRIRNRSNESPLEPRIALLQRRLVNERSLSKESAEWCVRTWLEALGLEVPSADPTTLNQKSDTE